MLKYVCFIYYFIWLVKIGSPAWRVNNEHMYHVIMRGWVEWQNTQTKTLLRVRYDTCYCLHLQLTNTTQAPHKHHTSTTQAPLDVLHTIHQLIITPMIYIFSYYVSDVPILKSERGVNSILINILHLWPTS